MECRRASWGPPGVVAVLLLALLAGRAEAQLGRVTGRVLDADTGQPIPGATITAESSNNLAPSFSVDTDDKGRFGLIGLRAGVWVFTASAPGYDARRGAGRFQALGSNPPIEFRLTRTEVPPPLPLAGIDARELQQDLAAAQALLDAGRYDEAISAYSAIAAKAPALTMIDLQIGRAHRMKKDYPAALAAYGRILQADPDNEPAQIELGLTELERGNLEDAGRVLTKAANQPAATGEVFFALGDVELAAGHPTEATTWYRKAAEASPTWVRPHFKLGLVAVNGGDRNAAIRYLEKVIALDATSAEASQARGLLEQLKP